MAIAIKTAAEIARKWGAVTPARVSEYIQGVQNPRRDWEEATLAAEPTYVEEVTLAANQGRFGRGVAAAGSPKQIKNAVTKGGVRFGPGVTAAVDDYARGFEPYRNEIAGLTLTPRRGRGSPQNLERVAEVANALHALRLRILGVAA